MTSLQQYLMFVVLVTQAWVSFGEDIPKSSLTFVIDDTGSMSEEIEQVKDSVNTIFETVTSSNKSQVENFILVTFNDPDAKLLTITNDRDTFKEALNGIHVHNVRNCDCPEYAMEGIKIALESSLPLSYVYVFTDASAKDYTKYEEIKSLSQKKQIQVTFLLTGECTTRSAVDYQVYHQISKATSGQVFNMLKEDVKDILKYIVESIKGKENVLVDETFPAGTHAVNFTVDKKIDNITIAVSGGDPTIKVSDPDGKDVPTKEIVEKPEIMIVKVPSDKPGDYVAEIGSSSSKTIKIKGKTTLDFQHGFSTFKPTALSETATRPAPDGNTYLSIQLVGEGVKLETVKLLDMSGKILKELPLRLINKKTKYYVTEEFNPPSESFRIAVHGYEEKTKSRVYRLSATPIERQKPIFDTKVDIAPKVKITGGPKVIADYNARVQVKCKIHGYPMPMIRWYDVDTGEIMSSKDSTIEAPYDIMSIVDIEKLKNSATFVCKASNPLGESEDQIKIEMNTYFNVRETPDDKFEIEYDKEGIIPCRVDAQPPATVNWFKNGIPLVNDSSNIIIAGDAETVTIKHMDTKSQGTFMCEVGNELNRKLFYSKVVVSGLAKPKIDKTDKKHIVAKGNDAELECRIIEGTPRPTIQWYYQSPRDAWFTELGYTGEVLKLDEVTIDQVGTYLCAATNELGSERYAVELVVEYPPTIKDSAKRMIAKDDDIVTIPCDVDGMPTPTVKWFKDGVLLDDPIMFASIFEISKDHSLKFRAKVLTHDGKYTCKAENPLGSKSKTIQVNVFDPPHIEALKFFIINTTIGQRERLPCFADGYPRPHIKWMYNDVHGGRKTKIRYGKVPMALNLKNIQLRDQGYFTCVATNVVGSARITYKVNVYARPKIVKTYVDNNFKAVTGDLLLKIACKATGGPDPTILWKKENLNIAAGSEWYDIDDGTLVIKNIDEASGGLYTCVAQNSIGNDTMEYNLNVTDYPLIDKPIFTMLIEEGKSANIPCNIPHMSVDLIRWYKDKKLISNEELTLTKTTLKDDGIYSCRISDFEKSTSSHVRVVVGYKPSFTSKEEGDIEFIEGDLLSLSCEANGEPKPEVSWRLNDEILDAKEMTYGLQMQVDNRGKYTCEVSNVFGKITRSFNITTKDCILDARKDFLNESQPLQLSRSFTWSEFDVYEGYLFISKGEPFYLYCQKGFSMQPSTQIMLGYCAGETNVNLYGKIVKYKDIACADQNEPTVRRKSRSCHTGNTELLEVGYEVYGNFLHVYDVCIDKDKNAPLYTRHQISSAQYGVAKSVDKWFTHELISLDFDSMYECRNQVADISYTLGRPSHEYGDCCYGKEQLVSPEDLKPGVPTAAAYTYLNVVPHWSTCNSKNWAVVEENVRKFAKLFDDKLTVWTGTAKRHVRSAYPTDIVIHDQAGRKQAVAQYLWKVVQDPASSTSLAIIQVNIPDLSAADVSTYVHCRDICSDIDWMQGADWHNVGDGYTYCCAILEFESAFKYDGKFNQHKTGILYKNQAMLKYYYST